MGGGEYSFCGVFTIKVVICVVPNMCGPHTVNVKKYLEVIPGKEWMSVATHTLGWGGKLEPGEPGWQDS